MPRLRLELIGKTTRYRYRYRWELLGKYGPWKQGFWSRLATVEKAFDDLRAALNIQGD